MKLKFVQKIFRYKKLEVSFYQTPERIEFGIVFDWSMKPNLFSLNLFCWSVEISYSKVNLENDQYMYKYEDLDIKEKDEFDRIFDL